MNFANLILTDANTYRFVCRDVPETVNETIEPEPELRLKKLTVTKKALQRDNQLKFRFEAQRSSNLLRRFFQPRIYGTISGSPAGTTVELKTQLPFLAVKLINLSANLSLFSLFGIFGSYLLLPNPAPLLGVLLKATVGPAIVALLLANVCKYFMRADTQAVADSLAKKNHAYKFESVPPIVSEVYAKTFFSLNSLITLIFCSAILAVACWMHNWAWNQWITGQYAKSEELCISVLDLARISLGKDNAGVAGCEYYIAECSRCEGKLDQAEKYYNQALSDFNRNVAPSHTIIADTIMNLGRVYEEQGKLDKALQNYIKAEKIYEDSPEFGPRCIWIAHMWNKIAAAQVKQNNYTEAEKNAKKALPIDITYKWEAGQSIAQDNNDLGVISYKKGDYAAAKRYFTEAINLKSNLGPAALYSKGTSLYNLSFVQEKMGEKAQSAKSRKEGLTLWLNYLGEAKGTTLGAHDLYARVLKKAKPDYETPNYDRRADMIIDGEGRI